MGKNKAFEPTASVKQDVVPAPGQKYKNGGGGFVIKDIVGSIAVCQLSNAQIRFIDVKKIPRYELSI